MSTPEGKVLRSCLSYLTLRGIAHWRINVIGTPIPGGGFRPSGSKGIADIIGVLPGGRALAVEVKSEAGRQSEPQREFERKWTNAGGVYLIVRSAAELNACLSRVRSTLTD